MANLVELYHAENGRVPTRDEVDQWAVDTIRLLRNQLDCINTRLQAQRDINNSLARPRDLDLDDVIKGHPIAEMEVDALRDAIRPRDARVEPPTALKSYLVYNATSWQDMKARKDCWLSDVGFIPFEHAPFYLPMPPAPEG